MSEKIKTDKLIIFDTTLRDGEQSAGASLTSQDKFRIASQLQKLNVDIIEAGFAASSPGDFSAVRKIASEIEGPTICTLARAVKGDIQSAIECVKDGLKPRIHTFLSTSDIHLLHQMKKDRESIMSMAIDAVKQAIKGAGMIAAVGSGVAKLFGMPSFGGNMTRRIKFLRGQ